MNAAAKLLETDWGSYRGWEDGTLSPSLQTALKIQDETGIPCAAWRDRAAS